MWEAWGVAGWVVVGGCWLFWTRVAETATLCVAIALLSGYTMPRTVTASAAAD